MILLVLFCKVFRLNCGILGLVSDLESFLFPSVSSGILEGVVAQEVLMVLVPG
jgi:hypothetical protein